jgi:hypothetical protein
VPTLTACRSPLPIGIYVCLLLDALASNTLIVLGSGHCRCACNTGYVGSGVDCRPSTICDVDNGGCHEEALCESTGLTARTCTCNATAGYEGNGESCTGPNPVVAAQAIAEARQAAIDRALAGLPVIKPKQKKVCMCPKSKPCKHDQADVCYPTGNLWGKTICWHGTSNCRKDSKIAAAADVAGVSGKPNVCTSGSCPAGAPCKHNRAPNCYPFHFGTTCYHGTTHCPPGGVPLK